MIHKRFDNSDLRYLYDSIRRKMERKEQRREFFEALAGVLLFVAYMYALVWISFLAQQMWSK